MGLLPRLFTRDRLRSIYVTMQVQGKPTVEITSCALGGHLLGRGTAVQRAIQEQMPEAEVRNSYGCPLQFSITVNDKQVLGGLSGTCAILQMLMCCKRAEGVANDAVASA